MRDLLVAYRSPEWPLVFAVDASTWDRCDAETSPQRGYYYSASKHSAGKTIVAGWSYQWVAGLDWAHDCRTAPMDAGRITPGDNTVSATVTQVRDLVARLAATGQTTDRRPVFVFDAGYDPIALSHELAEVPAVLVVRIRDDRVFYTTPETPSFLARPDQPSTVRNAVHQRGTSRLTRCPEKRVNPTTDRERLTTS